MLRTLLSLVILIAPMQASAEADSQKPVKNPTTYKECIQKASDLNSKWIEYRVDVNDCSTVFLVSIDRFESFYAFKLDCSTIRK